MPASEKLHLLAPAKINVFLRVTGKRPDGYHTLFSRMQKLSLYDELLLERIPSGLELSCPDGKSPEGPDNLAFRAASLFFARTGARFGLRITLKKNIPIAGGLGGGSSDAAAVLRGLQTLVNAPLAQDRLLALALELGADVPFFVQEAPAALARSLGEDLTPVQPLSGCTVLLVNPGLAVSTKWVYQNLNLTSCSLDDSFLRFCERGGHEDLVNDLEQVTIARYPVIGEVKETMIQYGAQAALMSGSGATVFGLFAESGKAALAMRHFQRRFQHTWLTLPLQD